MSFIKRQIRRFLVVVVQWTSKKCTKKRDPSDACAESCCFDHSLRGRRLKGKGRLFWSLNLFFAPHTWRTNILIFPIIGEILACVSRPLPDFVWGEVAALQRLRKFTLHKIKANFKYSGYFKINSRDTQESETTKNHEVARFIFFPYTCYTPYVCGKHSLSAAYRGAQRICSLKYLLFGQSFAGWEIWKK